MLVPDLTSTKVTARVYQKPQVCHLTFIGCEACSGITTLGSRMEVGIVVD